MILSPENLMQAATLTEPTEIPSGPLSAGELRKLDAYWRAANYLSVGQIYLYDNPLLAEPLRLENLKPRLLGHWGTIHRIPRLRSTAGYPKQVLRDHLIEHKRYVSRFGDDMPEIRNWRWPAA